jgi:Phosphatidate cytidylyltransferase, mitochondrial
MQQLWGLVDNALEVPGAVETARPFLDDLSLRARGVRAVLLYGSCLWSSVRGQHSQPDFIAIVDSLRAFHGGRLGQALVCAVLPPTVYRLRQGDAYAKLSVATVAQLRSQCGAGARDLHLAGRLSKRVALVWADDDARRLVVAAQVAALRTLAPLALSRFDGPVALDDFLVALLRLSYESEIRIVEPNKVAALFAAEREHYRAMGQALLAELGARPVGGSAALKVPAHAVASRTEVARRLRRSRRRALWRLPKYLVTYDGWLDYVLKKLARAGTPVALTQRQRSHPLLFGFPILWELAISRRLA